MRSVFTVDVPLESGGFPGTEKILELIRRFGSEPSEISALNENESEKYAQYGKKAQELFALMPEIAKEEESHVIFFGYIADDQTKFIVTRRVEGQITFRLLQKELVKLQASTHKVIRKILDSKLGDVSPSISNSTIHIYETQQDHEIISGRVIPSPRWETLRVDRKNFLLFLVPLLISVPLLITLTFVDLSSHELIQGTIERSSTAFLTTSLVSFIGLLQTYFEISRNKLISWNAVEAKSSK